MSENSTERDFEDYFAANAPVDALSKMEKAVQMLETIETEELRRTEQAMVSSALKSLRHSLQRWHSFRDEDTAGDSRENKPGCDDSPSPDGGQVRSSAASETLEPVAHMSVPTGLMDYPKPYLAEAHLTKYGMRTAEDGEPLVRPSDLEDYLYELSNWFVEEFYKEGEYEYNRGAQEAIDLILDKLARDITQLSEAE